MKILLNGALLAAAACVSLGQQQEQGEPALPALPTRAEVLALPAEAQIAARESVKMVMLHRTLRRKDDAARLTAANAAACLELAKKLHAPEPLTRMLELEASGRLSGRELHDYRTAFNRLVAAYGVDAVQMRLYAESQNYPTPDILKVLESMPLQGAFNLVPQVTMDDATVEAQMTTLGRVYARVAEVYAGVQSRAQADAAAEALFPLLAEYDTTSPLRLLLMRTKDPLRLPAFARVVHPAIAPLVEQRRRLLETDYYGSHRLSTLDFLLD